MSKRECEDCGDELQSRERRIKCGRCGQLVCGWCWHHIHTRQAISSALNAVAEKPGCARPAEARR